MNTTNEQNKWRSLEPGEIIQEGDLVETYSGNWVEQVFCTGQPVLKNGVPFRRPRPAQTNAERLADLQQRELADASATIRLQDLTLATLCDMVLGEDAPDRSDDALIRGVRRMINEAQDPTITTSEPGDVLKAVLAATSEECEWLEQDEGEFVTSCGKSLCYEEEPSFKDYPYCPGCGRKVEVKATTSEPGEGAGGGDHKRKLSLFSGGGEKCQCRLCQRGRRFYEIVKALPDEEQDWMAQFYDCVLDTECELEMREAAEKPDGGGDSCPVCKGFGGYPECAYCHNTGLANPLVLSEAGGGDQQTGQTAMDWVMELLTDTGPNYLGFVLRGKHAKQLADRADRAEDERDAAMARNGAALVGRDHFKAERDALREELRQANAYATDVCATLRSERDEAMERADRAEDALAKAQTELVEATHYTAERMAERDALLTEIGAWRATVEARTAEVKTLREALEELCKRAASAGVPHPDERALLYAAYDNARAALNQTNDQ